MSALPFELCDFEIAPFSHCRILQLGPCPLPGSIRKLHHFPFTKRTKHIFKTAWGMSIGWTYHFVVMWNANRHIARVGCLAHLTENFKLSKTPTVSFTLQWGESRKNFAVSRTQATIGKTNTGAWFSAFGDKTLRHILWGFLHIYLHWAGGDETLFVCWHGCETKGRIRNSQRFCFMFTQSGCIITRTLKRERSWRRTWDMKYYWHLHGALVEASNGLPENSGWHRTLMSSHSDLYDPEGPEPQNRIEVASSQAEHMPINGFCGWLRLLRPTVKYKKLRLSFNALFLMT